MEAPTKRRGFRNLAAKLGRLVEKSAAAAPKPSAATPAAGGARLAAMALPAPEDCARFDELELGVITKLYAELLNSSSPASGIDKATFLEYFQLPGLWADGLFKVFTNTDAVVTLADFVHGLSVCCRGTKTERVGILFKLFDMNQDGSVSRDELTAMLSSVPLLNHYLQINQKQPPLSRTHSKTTVLPDARRADESAASSSGLPAPDNESSLDWPFADERGSQASAAFDRSEDDDQGEDEEELEDEEEDDESFNDERFLAEPSLMVTEMLARVTRDEAVEHESNDLEALVSTVLDQYDACGSDCLDLDSFRMFVEHYPALLKLFSDCLREDVWSLKGHALGRAVHKPGLESRRSNCRDVDQWINVRKQFVKTAPKRVQPPQEVDPLKHASDDDTALSASPSRDREMVTDVSCFLGLSAQAVESQVKTRKQLELNCPSCSAPLVICPGCAARFPDLKVADDSVRVVCRACNAQFGECWICNYDFNNVLTCSAAASEYQMQGDLFSAEGVKYHFLLADRILYYFEKDGDKVPSGFIFLEGCYVEPLCGEPSAADESVLQRVRTARRAALDHTSETTTVEHAAPRSPGCPGVPSDALGFCIIPSKTSEKKKTLFAPDAASFQKWLDALKTELGQRPIQELYDMCETIGQGKFSLVYRAVERETAETVAIKVVQKGRMSVEEKELLKSEMCILRMLRHPHVIYLKQIVSSRESLYIVMEFVPGGELFKVISRQQGQLRNKGGASSGQPTPVNGEAGSPSVVVASKPLIDEAIVHRLTVQLLKTLAYLHKSGIVHRDLKPENILLTDSQDLMRADIKIADFGLSCLCGPNELLKQPCGTLVYVAPEVLRMTGYNHKVDVWSVGVVVYLLLCGKLPFPALRHRNSLDDVDAFFKLKYEGAAWSAVSATCKDFLSKLLLVDPQARFSSQQALSHIWIKNPAAVMGGDRGG